MLGINVKFMGLCTYVVVNKFLEISINIKLSIVIYCKIILHNPGFFFKKKSVNKLMVLIFVNIINN